MKKHYLALATVLLISSSCFAQKNTQSNNIVTTSKTIYAKALEYGDYNTAIVAAHTILANSPADYYYMDSLVSLYYTVGNYQAAANVGNDILNAAPQNVPVRELVANSQVMLGQQGLAVLNYEDLYDRTNDVFYLYNIATTQFGMKLYTESGATADRIIKADGNMELIPISTAEGQTQQIPLKAAAYNIKGAIAMAVNNKPIAKQNFEEALKISPDFALAKQNLAEVK